MKIEDVMPAFRKNKKISRKKWPKGAYFMCDGRNVEWRVDGKNDTEALKGFMGGIFSEDWFVVDPDVEVPPAVAPGPRRRVRG